MSCLLNQLGPTSGTGKENKYVATAPDGLPVNPHIPVLPADTTGQGMTVE